MLGLLDPMLSQAALDFLTWLLQRCPKQGRQPSHFDRTAATAVEAFLGALKAARTGFFVMLSCSCGAGTAKRKKLYIN